MAAETQIPAEAPNGGEKQERPQSALSKIFNAVKWCVKWAMAIAGVAIIIYQATFWPAVKEKFIAAAFGVLVLIIFLILKWKMAVELTKRVFITVFLVYVLCFIFFIIHIVYFPWLGSDVVSGITQEKLLSIKLGMDKNEVLDILGPDLYCDINRLNYLYNNNISSSPFVYATPGPLRTGFEFVINISDNKLINMYIQLSDDPIYECGPKSCPGVIDKKAIDSLCLLSNSRVLNSKMMNKILIIYYKVI